jgi:RecJ-like exonuclease
MLKIQQQLYDRVQVRGRVAIAPSGQLALGTSAELLLGFPDVLATVVHGKAKTPSWVRVSVRGTDECNQHLGRLLRRVSRRVGGSGGGHMLAAGAMVPSSQLKRFLNLFVRNIGS